MALKAPTIVIFDMDGTAVRHLDPRLLHILEKLDDFYYTASRFLRWIFRKDKTAPIIADNDEFLHRRKPRLPVHRAIHRVRRKPVEQIVEPCPGLEHVLNFLRDHNIPMALVSNGLGKGYGHDILKTFDLEQYFKATIFREDIKRSKPSPEGLLTALKHMNLTPSDNDVIWYIGDRRKDMIAAQHLAENLSEQSKVHVEPIAYALNAAVAVLEKNLGTEHIINSYADMKEVLENLLGSAAKQVVKKHA